MEEFYVDLLQGRDLQISDSIRECYGCECYCYGCECYCYRDCFVAPDCPGGGCY